MIKNKYLLGLLIFLAVFFFLIILLIMNNGRSGCTIKPVKQCNEVEKNKCLDKCDKQTDEMYSKCNGNEECIRLCYEYKSKCYMDCLSTWIKDC